MHINKFKTKKEEEEESWGWDEEEIMIKLNASINCVAFCPQKLACKKFKWDD